MAENRDLTEEYLDRHTGKAEFDAIVVGSGPGGATVARELSRRGARVLILERGGNASLKGGLLETIALFNGVAVGDNLIMGRALTTGGTTSVYLASTSRPPLGIFKSLGIDLSKELEEAERELPLATLPDALLRPQSLKLRESTIALGYEYFTSRMLVDQSKCSSGYSYEAKWTARRYVHEAVENTATLINQARVVRVLVEKGRAIGVAYELGKAKKNAAIHQAFGSKIILAAGAAATPIILRRSGVRNVADRGFYCHPSIMLHGTISGLEAKDGFGGSWGLLVDDDIRVGDANFDRTFHRLLMLSQRKWIRALSYARGIGLGVMVADSLGGELKQDDRYYKQVTKDDLAKLAKGEETARRIIEHAGGRNVLTTSVSASHIGGAIRINEHIDLRLETEFRNLYVCDGSVLPGDVKTPALPLICLGKYLANQLTTAGQESVNAFSPTVRLSSHASI